jgi:hypothetical protein
VDPVPCPVNFSRTWNHGNIAPGRLVGEKSTTACCCGAAATNRDGETQIPMLQKKYVVRHPQIADLWFWHVQAWFIADTYPPSDALYGVQFSGRIMLTRPSRQCMKAHGSYNNVKNRICKYWELEVQRNYFPGAADRLCFVARSREIAPHEICKTCRQEKC